MTVWYDEKADRLYLFTYVLPGLYGYQSNSTTSPDIEDLVYIGEFD